MSISKTKDKLSKLEYQSQKTYDNNLKFILDEADKITLDDIEFDNILKEQSSILCDIKQILHNESKNKNSEFICDISNIKNDNKFKKMIKDYTTNISSNTSSSSTSRISIASSNSKVTKRTKRTPNRTHNKSSKKSSSKKSSHSTLRAGFPKSFSSSKKLSHSTLRPGFPKSRSLLYKKSSYPIKKISKHLKDSKCPINIRKIVYKNKNKNKNIYKYNNRRKYDVTIKNPNIYIKDMPKINKLIMKTTPKIMTTKSNIKQILNK